jgi:hypothetical protein
MVVADALSDALEYQWEATPTHNSLSRIPSSDIQTSVADIIIFDGHTVESEIGKTLNPSILEGRTNSLVKKCHH